MDNRNSIVVPTELAPTYELEVDTTVLKPDLAPKIAEVSPGKPLNLRCSAKGPVHSPPELHLLHEGSFLQESSRVSFEADETSAILRVASFDEALSGTYECSVRNPTGARVRVKLTVLQKSEQYNATLYNEVPCKPELSEHCNNGGSCYYNPSLNSYSCRCRSGFSGPTCTYRGSDTIVIADPQIGMESYSSSSLKFLIYGTLFGALLFALLFGLVCFIWTRFGTKAGKWRSRRRRCGAEDSFRSSFRGSDSSKRSSVGKFTFRPSDLDRPLNNRVEVFHRQQEYDNLISVNNSPAMSRDVSANDLPTLHAAKKSSLQKVANLNRLAMQNRSFTQQHSVLSYQLPDCSYRNPAALQFSREVSSNLLVDLNVPSRKTSVESCNILFVEASQDAAILSEQQCRFFLGTETENQFDLEDADATLTSSSFCNDDTFILDVSSASSGSHSLLSGNSTTSSSSAATVLATAREENSESTAQTLSSSGPNPNSLHPKRKRLLTVALLEELSNDTNESSSCVGR